MKEVWFFIIRTNTGFVRPSNNYDSFEKAYEARKEVLDDPYSAPVSPVMKGYVKK